MYQFLFSVYKVLYRQFHDLFCIFSRCLGIETDKVRIRHLSDGRSCNKFGMEAFGERPQCREDTLNVYNNSLTCAGKDYVFLLKEVTCHRNSSSHSNFI